MNTWMYLIEIIHYKLVKTVKCTNICQSIFCIILYFLFQKSFPQLKFHLLRYFKLKSPKNYEFA